MKKGKIVLAVVFMQCLLILCGCQKSSDALQDNLEETNTFIEEEKVLENNKMKDENVDVWNTYYNVSAKYKDGYTYVASKHALYRINDNESEWEKLFDGPVTIGTMSENFLFFYTCPDNVEEAAIMALDFSNHEIIISYTLGKDIFQYFEMISENNNLYIRCGKEINSFTIQTDGTLTKEAIVKVEKPIIKDEPDIIAYPASEIISKGEGYSESFLKVQEEGNNNYNQLYICEGIEVVNKISDITDIMITSKGIIGRDSNNYEDIYLWDIYSGKKQSLYDSTQNDEKYLGYNTYNNDGVYGLLKEGEDSYYAVKVSWEGMLEQLFLINGIVRGPDVQMSVINNWIYYYNPQNEKMERRNLANIQVVETEN